MENCTQAEQFLCYSSDFSLAFMEMKFFHIDWMCFYISLLKSTVGIKCTFFPPLTQHCLSSSSLCRASDPLIHLDQLSIPDFCHSTTSSLTPLLLLLHSKLTGCQFPFTLPPERENIFPNLQKNTMKLLLAISVSLCCGYCYCYETFCRVVSLRVLRKKLFPTILGCLSILVELGG